MTSLRHDLLTSAAARSASCTLSLPSQPVALLRRSRVLRFDASGAWVAAESADLQSLEQLIADELPVHVTIRSHDEDVLFHTMPLAVDSSFCTPDKRFVTALLLKAPEKYSTSQRRKMFRVPMTPFDGVNVKVWRINDYVAVRDRPLPSQELPCDPKDLGEGGMCAVVFPNSHEALNLKYNQRFRVEVKCGRHEMLFEARLRHPEQTQRDDESAVCGFEFIHNDRDVENRRHRQKLQQLLSEIQRNAVKREGK